MQAEDVRISIQISPDLLQRLELRSKNKRFPSVEDYLASLLKEVANQQSNEALDDEEEEELMNRLRSLGYA